MLAYMLWGRLPQYYYSVSIEKEKYFQKLFPASQLQITQQYFFSSFSLVSLQAF